MRFTLTAHWASGGGQREEYTLDEMRQELESLARFLDGLAPGETITIKRIDPGHQPRHAADWAGRGFTRPGDCSGLADAIKGSSQSL